jgi:hypothetical protein
MRVNDGFLPVIWVKRDKFPSLKIKVEIPANLAGSGIPTRVTEHRKRLSIVLPGYNSICLPVFIIPHVTLTGEKKKSERRW